MSALADAARDYLRLRNSLGHELAEYHRELPRLVAFLEAEGLPTVTVAAALAWAQGPDVDPATSIAPRRMTIARGFARYLAGTDARTEVPPAGLVAGRRRWRPETPVPGLWQPVSSAFQRRFSPTSACMPSVRALGHRGHTRWPRPGAVASYRTNGDLRHA